MSNNQEKANYKHVECPGHADFIAGNQDNQEKIATTKNLINTSLEMGFLGIGPSNQDKAREIAHRIYDDWRSLQIDPDTNETMTAYGMVMKIAGEVSESQRMELEELRSQLAGFELERESYLGEAYFAKRELETAANAYLALAVKYDCLAHEHVTRGEQLNELRELCLESVDVLEVGDIDFPSWIIKSEKLLAKLKARLGKCQCNPSYEVGSGAFIHEESCALGVKERKEWAEYKAKAGFPNGQ